MTTMDKIRDISKSKLKQLGQPTNDNLPLLEDIIIRSKETIFERFVCLNMTMITLIGNNPRDRIYKWLENNTLTKGLSVSERNYFETGKIPFEGFGYQIESLYVFAWYFKLFDELTSPQRLPDNLATTISINTGTPLDKFKAECMERDKNEVIEKLDFFYCLHWSTRELVMSGQKPLTYPYVIEMRRKALEWICLEEDWDEISLDT